MSLPSVHPYWLGAESQDRHHHASYHLRRWTRAIQQDQPPDPSLIRVTSKGGEAIVVGDGRKMCDHVCASDNSGVVWDFGEGEPEGWRGRNTIGKERNGVWRNGGIVGRKSRRRWALRVSRWRGLAVRDQWRCRWRKGGPRWVSGWAAERRRWGCVPTRGRSRARRRG
jgi:hypothetical protein